MEFGSCEQLSFENEIVPGGNLDQSTSIKVERQIGCAGVLIDLFLRDATINIGSLAGANLSVGALIEMPLRRRRWQNRILYVLPK